MVISDCVVTQVISLLITIEIWKEHFEKMKKIFSFNKIDGQVS